MIEIGTILDIANLVYKQAEKAKTNKAQSKLLVTRVRVVEAAIRNADKLVDNAEFAKPLEDLHQCLQEALALVQKFSGKKWHDLRRILRAGKYQDAFTDLHQRLRDSVQFLNLGVDVQSLMNREQDVQAQQADAEVLQSMLDEIVMTNQAALGDLKDLSVQERARFETLRKQMSQSKSMLEKLLATVKTGQVTTDEKVADDSSKALKREMILFSEQLEAQLKPFALRFEAQLNQHPVQEKIQQEALTDIKAGSVNISGLTINQSTSGMLVKQRFAVGIEAQGELKIVDSDVYQGSSPAAMTTSTIGMWGKNESSRPVPQKYKKHEKEIEESKQFLDIAYPPDEVENATYRNEVLVKLEGYLAQLRSGQKFKGKKELSQLWTDLNQAATVESSDSQDSLSLRQTSLSS